MSVPPPRPSTLRVIETPTRVVNEDSPRAPRTTTIVVRWDSVLTVLASLLIGVAIGASVMTAVTF
jgi:hypothetical protein